MTYKELMLNHGMYNEELTNHEDFELLLRLMSKLKFYFCGAYTCLLRKNNDSAQKNYAKILQQGVKAIDYLFKSSEIDPCLIESKNKLYADEYLILASAAYLSKKYDLFRQHYKKVISHHLPSLWRKRFLKRLIISLIPESCTMNY